MAQAKSAITLTDAATARIRELLAARGKPCHGVRLGTKTKGCSGLAYAVDYVDVINPADEVIEDKGVKVFIDPQSLLYLIGSQMDFVQDTFSSGFTFNNPNAKGSCGCGESFHV